MALPSIEIERKFLVTKVPEDLDRHPADHVEQGYLAIAEDGVEVRLRRRAGRTVLTVKSGPAHVRVEEEMPIEPRRFEALWPLTEGRRVVKTRYLVPAGDGLTIELDLYAENLDGLVTAEIEFPSEAASAAFEPPAWLGADITGDARYANQSLALHGIPPR
ncbi:MAG TPA: CYTH domain-containing protein [Solirubrobacteraceae bacterium]|nr:CYTH domain-containing protein [Solirubrobacteraceae bacterium]